MGKDKRRDNKRWVREVKTVSTYPPEGLFTKDAPTIARTMASKKVSPKGIGSGIRMIQFFINRAGKSLPKSQKRELEKAKHMLQEKAKGKKGTRKEERKEEGTRKIREGKVTTEARRPRSGKERR